MNSSGFRFKEKNLELKLPNKQLISKFWLVRHQGV